MKERREQILFHHQEMIRWVKSLSSISKEAWLRPTEKNKWSIAEIISHFSPWDDFVVSKRLPYLGTGEPLPSTPDPQVLNEQAALLARSTEQAAVIQSFIDSRSQLIASLQEILDESWGQTFKLGEKEMDLSDYVEGLAEHDLHHKQQIEKALAKQNAQI
ncbi:DinB family protein [Bacillus sp. Marseille-Q1617]|uniref:DinB family protein n=1 Tax=Bacillus sp. Marseille-Q1617 TaxID=2736887 RepID=UPI001589BE06|nr:DinB family protein [Bacillus sp. Marseille-Q1617]